MNSWIARNLLYRPLVRLRGEPVFSLLERYRASQWWPRDRIEELQRELLGRILAHAAREVPFYRQAAREAGLEPEEVGADHLQAFPLLEKRHLQEHLGELSARVPRWRTTVKTTGGSTGVPVRLRKNRRATAAEQAASWRSYGWYGIRPGDRQARFWGVALSRRARLRYRAIDLALNRDRFSAFAFSEEDLARYYRILRRRRPAWAYGYVSMLAQFASYCLDQGLPLADLGVRAVVSTSEVLTRRDRELISEAFGAPVYDEYGCGEVGAVLYECERGRLHLMAENLFVELLPDPTPDEPEAARLVVTDLHNRATPLIRYNLGDRVVPAPPCSCGRGLPAYQRVFGRAYDFITAPDGTRFHGEFFMYLLEEAHDRDLAIGQAQFVEVAPGRIEVRVVPRPGYEPAQGDILCAWLAERSRGRLTGSAVVAEEIPRLPSGKLRVITRMPPGEVSA